MATSPTSSGAFLHNSGSSLPPYYSNPPPLPFHPGSSVQIHGQTHRSDLNGKFGTVQFRDGLRVNVVTSSGDFLSISDHHLRDAEIAVGGRIVVVGNKVNPELNGRFGTVTETIDENDEYTITLQHPSHHSADSSSSSSANSASAAVAGADGTTGGGTIKIKSVNVVLSPLQSDLNSLNLPQPVLNKRRRFIPQMAAAAAAAATADPQQQQQLKPAIGAGSTAVNAITPANLMLLHQQAGNSSATGGAGGVPLNFQMPSSTTRLTAVDATVAISSDQPILKRCGTLRKLVYNLAGFAPLGVVVMARMHLDPQHPGRHFDAHDAIEGLWIASLLTDGKLDGVLRKDIRQLDGGAKECEYKSLSIADRHCGANHLIYAIDINYCNIRDELIRMIRSVTAGDQSFNFYPKSATQQQQQPQDPAPAASAVAASAVAPVAPLTEDQIPFQKQITRIMKTRSSAASANPNTAT